LEVACSTISLLLTDKMCDPVIGGRMTLLPVTAQCWLAYHADSELDGQQPASATCLCLSRYMSGSGSVEV